MKKLTIALALFASALSLSAFAKPPKLQPTQVGENDSEFIFVGKCDSGKDYRMRAYQVAGVDKYDYTGPLGSGTINSAVPAREAKDYVCMENDRGTWKADVVSQLGENDTEFVFMDKCASGAPYRLRAYQAVSGGQMRDMFDFTGPLGHGTIRSNMPAKEAKMHVCQESMHAEVK